PFRALTDAGPDRCMRQLGHAGEAASVAVVDDPEHLERRDLQLEMPFGGLVRRGANAAWPEPRAGTVADAVVPGCSDDGDVRPHVVELVGGGEQRHPG